MKNTILTLILLAASSTACHASEVLIDGIYYLLNSSSLTAQVTVHNEGFHSVPSGYGASTVTIPASISFEGEIYSVTSIGSYAFEQCTSLTTVSIPNSVTSIGSYAFKQCTSLTTVTIPNSVTSIGEGAFELCSALTSVTISNSITSIRTWTFSTCRSLTSVTIPNSVSKIENYAFQYCTSLASVSIPNSVKTIEEFAFDGCYFIDGSIINNTTLSDSNYWGATFCDTEQNDGLLVKDNKVVKCRTWASDITIPNSITSIGYAAFWYCDRLTSVIIPNSVTSIGKGAFVFCSSLTSVTIPNSVSSIGESIFYRCSNLTDVYCYAETVPTKADLTLDSNRPLSAATLHVPETSISLYQNAENWQEFGSIVAIYTNNVPIEGVFYNLSPSSGTAEVTYESSPYSPSYTGDVTIPASFTYDGVEYSVTRIGEKAFRECYGLSSISIPQTVTSIGNCAFTNCENLTSLILPESLTEIEHSAFYGCRDLTGITIPSSVTAIGEHTFGWCYLRKENFINNTSLSDPDYWEATFCDVEQEDGLLIKDNVAVCARTWATSVTIPDSVTSIAYATFWGCGSLNTLIIPKSVTSVSKYTFVACLSLSTIYCYAENVPTTEPDAFGFLFPFSSATLYVPITSISQYQNADQWKEFRNIKPCVEPRFDLNGDGRIDIADITLLVEYVKLHPELIIQ